MILIIGHTNALAILRCKFSHPQTVCIIRELTLRVLFQWIEWRNKKPYFINKSLFYQRLCQ